MQRVQNKMITKTKMNRLRFHTRRIGDLRNVSVGRIIKDTDKSEKHRLDANKKREEAPKAFLRLEDTKQAAGSSGKARVTTKTNANQMENAFGIVTVDTERGRVRNGGCLIGHQAGIVSAVIRRDSPDAESARERIVTANHKRVAFRGRLSVLLPRERKGKVTGHDDTLNTYSIP